MTTEKEMKQIQNEFKERMDEGELLNCMRCGFCLPSCPTYIEYFILISYVCRACRVKVPVSRMAKGADGNIIFSSNIINRFNHIGDF